MNGMMSVRFFIESNDFCRQVLKGKEEAFDEEDR